MTFSDAKESLFQNPMNQSDSVDMQFSDFIYIIDNTFMVACLRAVMNQTLIQGDPQICDNLNFTYQTLTLASNVTVNYSIGDRWFMMTITFASLNFLFLCLAIWFAWFYKKTKEEHLEFRKRKEKWIYYDAVYKSPAMPQGGAAQQRENEEDNLLQRKRE